MGGAPGRVAAAGWWGLFLPRGKRMISAYARAGAKEILHGGAFGSLSHDGAAWRAHFLGKPLLGRMVVTIAQLESKIKDTSGGCGASFEIGLVVSDSFEGKRALQRHRPINTALSEEIKDIHALSIKKTYTPAEFEGAK